MRISVGRYGTLELPPHLMANLRAVHGERVAGWLESLPATLCGILDELDATIEPGDPPLSYHLVFFARQADGTAIVVKSTVPSHEQPPELAAVHALSDAGIGPRLIWSDLDRGVLVLERVRPGEMLPRAMPSIEEDAAIVHILATLASRMSAEAKGDAWRDELVSVRQYTQAIDEVDPGSSLWARHRVDIERARELRNAMLEDPRQPHAFLHGDLQHHNVLADAGGGVRVIDPKGLIGPAGYEFGALTYNPPYIQHHPDIAAIERQRVDIWSDVTGIPWEVVRAWGYIGAVVSACWSNQGGAMTWTDAMQIAEVFHTLRSESRAAGT
jgi:streptomycin 6-kinase